jgi:hypothetical protein
MGQMRFFSPDPSKLTSLTVDRAYLAGIDGIPWYSRNLCHQRQLILERPVRESGNLFIPWAVEGYGEVMLSTASLMECEKAYHLPIELARGSLNRLRALAAEAPGQGWLVPAELEANLAAASRAFIEAVTVQPQPELAAAHAEKSMAIAIPAIDALTLAQAEHLLSCRHQTTPRLSTLMAGAIDVHPSSPECEEELVRAFNSAAVTMSWRAIEENAGQFRWEDVDRRMAWARQRGLRVCLGPLLRLDRASLPDWVYLWEDDFEQLQACVYDYIHAAAQHFLGKVQIWHIAAGLNVGGELTLSEDQRLRLVVGVIDTLRRVDRQTPIVISFDQPWAEYLAKNDSELSPLHFADVLHRAELGIAGLGLELNFGYWPGGTLPRDLLEISHQLDRWSSLGLPLLISFTAPSSATDDRQVWGKSRVAFQNPEAIDGMYQRRLAQQLLTVLLAKMAVHGIIWNQLFDSEPHPFPHGGLFDGQRRPKPALAAVQELRRQYLV